MNKVIQISPLLIFYIFYSATVNSQQIQQVCKRDSIPASTPDSQLVDNGDGTITDSKTGLMWKKCLEGASGASCDIDSPIHFTWQESLERIGVVNNGIGFAGYTDWRLPNIRELISIVEEQCAYPAINTNHFPTLDPYSWSVWSASPYIDSRLTVQDNIWVVSFFDGSSVVAGRSNQLIVRLVRDGK